MLHRYRVPLLRELDPVTGTVSARLAAPRNGTSMSILGRLRGNPRRREWHHRSRVLECTIGFCTDLGVRAECVISDNAFACHHSAVIRAIVDVHGIAQKFIRPHCRWPNGRSVKTCRGVALGSV